MTNEEKEIALYCLKATSGYHSEVCEECVKYPICDHTMQDDVIETIIKALEQQPCEDCISRQATVERLCKVADFMNEKREGSGSPYIMAALFIQDNKYEFPSVTPKEKTGKWQIIEGLGYYTCSVCKCDSDVNSSYCPNCGAKMEGEELVEFDEEEESEVSE